jgi:P-type Ca2+ transporter type 2C
LQRARTVKIFARIQPADKLRIIEVLRQHGHVIAMTGDGVNDAPALKKADMGVAMGQGGTDVAREASHMVLMDDSFSTIVAAVEEGRTIYANIRKFVVYNLTGIAAELFVILAGIFLGTPLPLSAIQILALDMGTEVFPSLALGTDTKDGDLMRRKPRRKSEHLLNSTMVKNVLFHALIITVGVLAVFFHYLPQGPEKAQTMAFVTFALFQIFNVFNVRHETDSAFKSFFSNKNVFVTVAGSLALVLLLLYVPVLHVAFHLGDVILGDWWIALGVSSLTLILTELWKFGQRNFVRHLTASARDNRR